MRRVCSLIAAVGLLAGCDAPVTVQPPVPPPAEVDHLAEAAACADRGELAEAVPHLRSHLDDRPGAVMVRAYLAELLLKTGRTSEAREQFERFVRDADDLTGPAHAHLVQVHTRLMELAEADGDEFARQYHRGVGLVLLVRQWDASPADGGEVLTQQTLAKAVTALRAADADRPTDPRAAAYLADAYERLGQPSAARAARLKARALLPDPQLSASELAVIERRE